MSNNPIPYINIPVHGNNQLIMNAIYSDLNNNYYWSDNFSPNLYIFLAQAGFISTSTYIENFGDILLPEIQKSYAVLDFNNLHIGKKVKKLLNEDVDIKTGKDIQIFSQEAFNYHKNECWLTESYINLLNELTNYNLISDNFELQTTLLYKGNDLTAGEIGYFIGTTYTSLTGFFNREFNNYGKLQMVLLAKELEKKGVSFWNLGHPYMDYKLKLGAKILNRSDFLKKWLPEITKK